MVQFVFRSSRSADVTKHNGDPKSPPAVGRTKLLLCAALIVAAAAAAYSDSFAGQFLLDDASFTDNPQMHHVWPIWDVLTARPRSRPVVNLTFAINYALAGKRTWSYHAVNLAIHVLAAMTLFGLVRRTLLLDWAPRWLSRRSAALALATALLWTVHPLTTAAVTYIVQRSESMMALFYLLSIYCLLRGSRSSRSQPWYVAAVLSCASGMGCKQVMVTAPLVMLLYDRVFLSASWRQLLRRRWAVHLAMTATWAILLPSVPMMFNNPSAGFGMSHMSWQEYARSQPGVILHYMRLAFWPAGLCLDYMWPVAEGWGEIVPAALILLVLLIGSLWALRRIPAAGFAALWVFIILLPSSSILPISDLAFEHRMYLPLTGLAALVAVGGYAVLRLLVGGLARSDGAAQRWTNVPAAVVVSAVVVLLGVGTYRRNKVYHSIEGMWADVVRKRPDNYRALNNYGYCTYFRGDVAEAIDLYHRALSLNPGYAITHRNLADALVSLGRLDEAIEHYRRAYELKSDDIKAVRRMALVCYRRGRYDQALQAARAVLAAEPNAADANYLAAMSLSRLGRYAEAVEFFRRALVRRSDDADAHYNFGVALNRLSDQTAAAEEFRRAIALNPNHYKAHANLAMALRAAGKLDEARKHLEQALRFQPDYVLALVNLAAMDNDAGRYRQAVERLRQALQLRPDSTIVIRTLASILTTCPDETIRDGQEALKLARKLVELTNHNDPQALAILAEAYEQIGQRDQATDTLRRAIDLALRHGDNATAIKLAETLKQYRLDQPETQDK